MKMAIGMVAAIVNVPHGLPFSALTTTRPTTARRMIMINSTVTRAMKPPTLPISSRAIRPNDFPSRRMEGLGSFIIHLLRTHGFQAGGGDGRSIVGEEDDHMSDLDRRRDGEGGLS